MVRSTALIGGALGVVALELEELVVVELVVVELVVVELVVAELGVGIGSAHTKNFEHWRGFLLGSEQTLNVRPVLGPSLVTVLSTESRPHPVHDAMGFLGQRKAPLVVTY